MRGDNALRDDQASLKISSDPEGAQTDGALVGNTPWSRTVQPGEHKGTLKQKAGADWGCTIAGEACCNFQKAAGERLVGSTGRRLMQPVQHRFSAGRS